MHSNSTSPIPPADRNPTGHASPVRAFPREPMSVLRLLIAQVRHHWIAGLFSAAVVVGGLSWIVFHGPPEHTAVITMVAENPLDRALDPSSESGRSANREENILRTLHTEMQSRTFRMRLIKGLNEEEAAAVQAPYLEPGQSLDPALLDSVLESAIKVERERGRQLFTVHVRHRDPAVAVMIADRFASEYLTMMREQALVARDAAAEILRTGAQRLEVLIERLQNERRTYRRDHDLISVEENAGIIQARLRRINEELSDVRVRRSTLEAQVARAEADIKNNPRPYANATLANFGGTAALRVEAQAAEAERAVLARQFGPNHPRMIEINQRINTLEEAIDRNFRLALDGVQGELALARASEQRLNEALKTAFDQSLELEMLSAEFNRLGSELEARRSAHADILARLAAVDVAADRVEDSMRIVDAAFLVPPGMQQRVIVLALISLAGLAAYVTVPIGLFLANERVTGNADVEALVGKEVIGTVPRFPRLGARHRPHVVRENRKPAFVEPYLSIVGQLEFLSRAGLPRCLIVTSALPGEGKSITASNLASGFTRLGRRTVLIDFDLRRPTQHDLHGAPANRGLLGWAEGGFRIDDDLLDPGGPLALRHLPDGTAFIPAGGLERQPGRLLLSPELGALFQRLRAAFDVILIDTPPAGLFQDALILAQYGNESVLVAREGRAHLAQVRRVVRELEKTAAPVAGIVLNAFTPRAAHTSFAYREMAEKYGYDYKPHQRTVRPTVGQPQSVVTFSGS